MQGIVLGSTVDENEALTLLYNLPSTWGDKQARCPQDGSGEK